MGATPLFISTIQSWSAQVVNADGVTLKDLVTAGASGSEVMAIAITSTDPTVHDVSLYANNGTIDLLLATVNVGSLAGTTGTAPAVDFLSSLNAPWISQEGTIKLKTGWKLRVGVSVTVSVAKAVTVVAYGGDY